jgi:hypothetical protein
MAKPGSHNDPEKHWEQLSKLLQTAPSQDSYQHCLEKLDDYVAAQLAGGDYMSLYPDVALHLDSCLECAEVYERAYELELALIENRLPQPDRMPAPDLSFLGPERARPTLLELLRVAIHQTSRKLTLQFSADLLALLQSSPVPSFKQRDDLLWQLQPDQLPASLPITVSAYRNAADEASCVVEISVKPPGRSWPELADMQVTLSISNAVYEKRTDPWGVVAFEAIPIAALPQMKIEVALTS